MKQTIDSDTESIMEIQEQDNEIIVQRVNLNPFNGVILFEEPNINLPEEDIYLDCTQPLYEFYKILKHNILLFLK